MLRDLQSSRSIQLESGASNSRKRLALLGGRGLGGVDGLVRDSVEVGFGHVGLLLHGLLDRLQRVVTGGNGAFLAALSTTARNFFWASAACVSNALPNSAPVPEAMSYR